MKALKLIVIAIIISLANILQAQVSVNINIGSPPPWGPVGYNEVQYYYLPDVEAYYDVHTSMFIYLSGGSWIHRTHLPSHHRHYDLYNGHKVVLGDYRGNSPYSHFNDHKVKYAKGYKGNPQKTIGQKPGKGNSKANSGKKEYNGHRDNDGGNSNSGKKSNGKGGGHKKK